MAVAAMLVDAPSTQSITSVASGLPTGLYPELKKRIQRAGLLAPQPAYYCRTIGITILMGVASLVVLLSTRNMWVQIVNALFLAQVASQLSFIGHDIGHLQVVRAGRKYRLLTFLFGNLLTGISLSWWKSKHDPHHVHPNRTDYDPNIMLAVVAFSSHRARRLNWFQLLFVRHQHFLFTLMLPFESVVLRASSISYVLQKRPPRWGMELLLLCAHIGLYAWLVVYCLGPVPAMLFILVHQAAYGFQLGAVFAPNHKGMPVFDDDSFNDFFLEQVLASRNVAPSRLIHFLYGGLNFQIEHHLFPTMPRNRLHAAQPLVRAFCAEHGIPYCQTSARASWRAIFTHLRGVSASLGG